MIKPYKRRVFYYETDKMSIMHHSNYIRIFEEARVDFLRHAGMPFEEIEARGILMPVLGVECEFKRPLRFDEEFEVKMEITKFNGVSLYVNYLITNCATGELCAVGKSSHCFTDEALKPLRVKHKYPDIYAIFAEKKES